VQEIIEGLKAGETVVVSGQNRLSDGTAVVLQSAEPSQPGAKPALAGADFRNTTSHESR
jgi:hypothetical protein